jgi:exopolysaccharide biosynthesis polyprenyl glycosylphosphotransferase
MLDSVSYETSRAAYEVPQLNFQTQGGAAALEEEHSVYSFWKRFFDVLLSSIALVVLIPLFLLTALCVKLEDGGPVFYTQYRVGKDGKQFKIYKFRSMCVNADEKLEELKEFDETDGPVFKMSNDPRVTKVGRIIRKASIDELPQLANIIRGDMSIVGPRPPLPREVEQYTPEQMKRLAVKPGLTCYWQCSGRNSLSFDEWMELDRRYIRERSLGVDLKIILKTVPAVLTGRGAC